MKKTLALFLALVMMLSLLPFSAFAEDALNEEISESLEETVKEEVEEPGGDPASEPGNGSAEQSGENPVEEPVVDPADDPKLLLSNEAQTLAATNADLSSLSLYVAADDNAGLDGTVKIMMNEDNVTGNIYLPGTAAIGSLYLSWTPANGIWVIDDTGNLESGQVSLPAAGESKTYVFSDGSETRSITLTTVQGSETVAGMFINVDESLGTISAMNSDIKHETRCYGNVDFEYTTYFMSIKGRGNWTWVENGADATSKDKIRDKRPYNITIHKDNTYDKKKKTSFIPGVESKAWTLIANYADGTLMHNKVAYDLACKLGIGFQSRYIDVWMNGEYYGNYLMTPKNDYLTSDDGYSLELDNNNDGMYPDTTGLTVVNSFRLTGLDKYGSTDNVITVKDVGDNAAKELEAVKDRYGECEPIRTWMQTMLNAVMDSTSDDYRKYIDVDSWAKFYLFYEYCKSIDMLCGSMLMHRDGLTENDKLIAGPIWDMDVAFGHVFNSGKFGISSDMQVSANGWIIDSMNGCTAFLQYLGKHQDFIERVYEIYYEYKDAFNYSLDEVDVLKEQISASAAMNYTRYSVTQREYNATYFNSNWGKTRGSGKYAYTMENTKSWDDYIKNFKSYLTNRLAFLSDNLTVTENPSGTATGETSYTAGDTVSLTADISSGKVTSYQWQSSADGKSWTDIAGATSATYSAIAQQKNMNGVSYRCLVKGDKTKTISTTRVAKGTVTGRAYLGPLTLSVNATALSQNISITENGETKTPETASENTKAVVKEITENSKIDKTNIQDVIPTEADAVSMLKIVLTAVSVNSGENVTTDTIKYDVKPVLVKKTSTASETTEVTNEQLAEMLQEAGETAITFRLAVPSSMKATGDKVIVSHYADGQTTPDSSRLYDVKGKDSNRYVEVSASSFSTYELRENELDIKGIKLGYSLELNESTYMDVYFRKVTTGTDINDYKVSYTFNGSTSEKVVPTINMKILQQKFNSTEYTQPVTVDIYYKDTLVDTREFSVQRYCKETIDDTALAQNIKDLCRYILDFGYEAQMYFDKYTDMLPEDTYRAKAAAATVVPEYTTLSTSGDLSAVNKITVSLELNETTEFNYYIYMSNQDDSISDYQVEISNDGTNYSDISNWDDCALTLKSKGVYQLKVSRQKYSLLDTVYYVRITKNQQSKNIGYSVMSFASKYQEQITENPDALVNRALYNYHAAAKAYFNK